MGQGTGNESINSTPTDAGGLGPVTPVTPSESAGIVQKARDELSKALFWQSTRGSEKATERVIQAIEAFVDAKLWKADNDIRRRLQNGREDTSLPSAN